MLDNVNSFRIPSIAEIYNLAMDFYLAHQHINISPEVGGCHHGHEMGWVALSDNWFQLNMDGFISDPDDASISELI